MGGATTTTSILSRLTQITTCPKTLPKPRQTNPEASIVSVLNINDLPQCISVLKTTSHSFSPSTYIRLLKLCSLEKDIIGARRVESHIISASYPSPPVFLLNRAIETFANLGCLSDAQELFDEMPDRNTGTYNTLISAYTRAGHPMLAVKLFSRMNLLGLRYTDVTFASVLRATSDLLGLGLAEQVHGLIEKSGFCQNVILSTALVDVYGKCGMMKDARRVFDSIVDPNEVSWNVIVRRYLEAGRGEEAVCMFFRMMHEEVNPLNFTVSSTLIACSSIHALLEGIQVHGIAVKIGYGGDSVVENSLVEMYSSCGDFRNACRVFENSVFKDVISWTLMVSGFAGRGDMSTAIDLFNEMPERNVVSWNALLTGYIRLSQWEEGLALFHQMRRETEEIDNVTLGLVLNVCARMSYLCQGRQVHGYACRHGLTSDLHICNALLDMYAKCGNVKNAELLFIKMESLRDRISWNSLLTGYTQNGRSEEALFAFRVMLEETSPNVLTFSTMLAACANVFALEFGKQMHGYMFRNGYEMNVVMRGALVDMYSKCRYIEYALKVFEGDSLRDVVLWNSMILGCAYSGRGEYGLKLFEEMKMYGVTVDNVTFLGVLLSCTVEGNVELGLSCFASMVKDHGVIPRLEHYECMIELLGRQGRMVELEDFIENMKFEPTIPMWTRVFDCCRKFRYARLGEKAARFINESNPPVSVRFEVNQSSDNKGK